MELPDGLQIILIPPLPDEEPEIEMSEEEIDDMNAAWECAEYYRGVREREAAKDECYGPGRHNQIYGKHLLG